MERKTPLYETHVSLKGKIVPFAGYLLPVQYEGVIAEHMAVRTKAGMFDVSHMGEVRFTGKDAASAINYLVTNDISGMAIGQARYSPLCNENGGIVDDLIIYRMGEEEYIIVVNASNREKDVDWMKAHLIPGDVLLEDISGGVAQIALQGPMAPAILKKLADEASIPKKYYYTIPGAVVAGKKCLMVSRTGYTGEDGYEIYCDAKDACYLWEKLTEAGAEFGLAPCGLGARDTLRLEAAMPLYGHEMDDGILPTETGLGFAVKLSKDSFIGKEAIAAKVSERTRVGLKVTGKGIVREHCELFIDGEKIGFTTSGTHSPLLGYPIAMALVDSRFSQIGAKMNALVRGREIETEVVPLPFYKRPKGK